MPVRRILLELWAMSVMAVVVAFLGPFGTYDEAELPARLYRWWVLLIGTYLMVRPAIFGLGWLARRIELPETAVTFWGVMALSGPIAVVWRLEGETNTSRLDSYATLIPFALLCAIGVLAVVQWAQRADQRLTTGAPPPPMAPPAPVMQQQAEPADPLPASGPALLARLSPRFRGPILALQSEDHYVRVHGQGESELLLMRLRDAIAEMDGVPGQQVHRSWWIAREAVAEARPSGRSWQLILTNGLAAPVARDTVSRLRGDGLLPADAQPA